LFGVEEVLLLSVIVLVVFGPDKLPEVARVLGKAAREFRKVTYSAQRAWDEIGREMDLQEALVKAKQLEEKRQAEAGSQADEGLSASAGDLPPAGSAPAVDVREVQGGD
jgi:TatA/E family protein of Tat protein translocase